MKLIEAIKNDEVLRQLICCECQENKIFVSISYEREKIIILNIEEYYRVHPDFKQTPNAPDCLIIQHCENEVYKIFVVELKNTKSAKSLGTEKKQNIPKKFETCLKDFMETRFPNHFTNPNYQIELKLILVAGNINIDKKQTKPVRLDFIDSFLPLQFNGLLYQVEKENPFPLIKKG